MILSKYRLNAIKVNSISSFFNIKGGINNGVRDVYFVRALGESTDFTKYIKDIDERMDIEMSRRRLIYKRISSLPVLENIDEAKYYSKQYAYLTENQKISLYNIKICDDFNNVLYLALSSCIDLYKQAKLNMTPSMEKNFGTKLLFWLDKAIGECLNGWSERVCIKIVADNVINEKEYMFYLFLTLLGCDVILIENRGDINIDNKLLEYSSEISLGEYGKSYLTPYKQNIQGNDSKKNTHNPKVKKDIQMNGREDKKESVSNMVETAKLIQAENDHLHSAHNAVSIEKTFEELALLASSVVLIAVHNANGDIIGSGSGIMVGKQGYILTNNHVALGGVFYSVRIEDDENVYTTNEVIKYNSATDLAIIRIQRKLHPIPIYMGQKKLVRGQKVIAIGSPLGLFNSVSDGIISGFRKIDNVDMIQFTAPISHGSSGGAVINMEGEVIGISTAGFDEGQNINLAIGYENIIRFVRGFTD